MKNIFDNSNSKEKDLLLIIDMQNVYLPGQPWACPNIKRAISYIEKKICEFTENQIIFTQYQPFDCPKGVWKDYNIVNAQINCNSWLNDYVEELKPYLTDSNFYSKSTYSCCKSKELYKRIDSYERVFVVGVVAECCVLATVLDLIDMGKKVIYLKEGVAGESEEKEDNVITILEGLCPLHILFY
ncbi:Isochorismatase family protein [Clostridiales bacterium CHKCI001]|nr:Isochorismatase family protein [Clostridiales bacterium CHKCI001]